MKAHYHTEGNAPHEMEVLKQNTKEGTVDIGVNGVAIVTDCPVSKESKIGHATLVEEAKTEKK